MKTSLIILCSVVLIVLAFIAYYGGFTKIDIHIEEQGGETVVYEDITGDYRKSGLVMDKIYHSLLKNEGIETYKGYGEYFDNPQKVEKSQLRSQAGSIIEEEDLPKLLTLTGDFKVKQLPKQDYIVAEFPYKGKISILFSIFRVYPALQKFSEENDYSLETSIMEIYDMPNKKIRYRKAIQPKE